MWKDAEIGNDAHWLGLVRKADLSGFGAFESLLVLFVAAENDGNRLVVDFAVYFNGIEMQALQVLVLVHETFKRPGPAFG